MTAAWRRWGWLLVVGAVVVLGALIMALLVPRGSGEELDPDNPAPEGTKAIASILRDQGVKVRRVTRSMDAAAAPAGSTLLVVNPHLLGNEQLDRLAGSLSDLVLVAPDLFTVSALAPSLTPAGVVRARTAEPGCSDPDASAAGPVRAGGHLYQLQSDHSGAAATLCYADDRRPDTASVVVTTGARRVTVIGQEDLLTNEFLAEDGNAALGLRLLGRQNSLVWYLPDPLEANPGQQTPLSWTDLLPTWVGWVTAQLVITVLVAMIWRARRMGRLVREPLPVVVRAAETQEGRARLYRQSRARGRAAATLRTAILRRLATRLSAPAGTTPEQVVRLVTAVTGQPEADVHRTLLGPAPASDHELVALADELDALVHALSAASGPSGTPQLTAQTNEHVPAERESLS